MSVPIQSVSGRTGAEQFPSGGSRLLVIAATVESSGLGQFAAAIVDVCSRATARAIHGGYVAAAKLHQRLILHRQPPVGAPPYPTPHTAHRHVPLTYTRVDGDCTAALECVHWRDRCHRRGSGGTTRPAARSVAGARPRSSRSRRRRVRTMGRVDAHLDPRLRVRPNATHSRHCIACMTHTQLDATHQDPPMCPRPDKSQCPG